MRSESKAADDRNAELSGISFPLRRGFPFVLSQALHTHGCNRASLGFVMFLLLGSCLRKAWQRVAASPVSLQASTFDFAPDMRAA